ncbi:MAG: XRE family transcriptional regulator, partial [Verrucomicrobiae bacterium]|nr:XRE family transcriptional regulator [Verrucomicrobiae bacterium]
MNLGERIQHLRNGAGLSQEQLASIVGVSRQAISKWETDQSLPDLDKIVLLCEAFSVSADDLLGQEPKDSNNAVQMEYY